MSVLTYGWVFFILELVENSLSRLIEQDDLIDIRFLEFLKLFVDRVGRANQSGAMDLLARTDRVGEVGAKC